MKNVEAIDYKIHSQDRTTITHFRNKQTLKTFRRVLEVLATGRLRETLYLKMSDGIYEQLLYKEETSEENPILSETVFSIMETYGTSGSKA